MGEGLGLNENPWASVAAALVGIQEHLRDYIVEAASSAAYEASEKTASWLSVVLSGPAEAPPIPETAEAMAEFKRACELGARWWDRINLTWDSWLASPPEVAFGASLGKPEQAVYRLDSPRPKNFWANGFWTDSNSIAEDFRERPTYDERSKRSAFNALEDLQSIQRSAQRVMENHKEQLRQEMDAESVDRRYQEMVSGMPFGRNDTWMEARMNSSCEEVFKQISDYLADLNGRQA